MKKMILILALLITPIASQAANQFDKWEQKEIYCTYDNNKTFIYTASYDGVSKKPTWMVEQMLTLPDDPRGDILRDDEIEIFFRIQYGMGVEREIHINKATGYVWAITFTDVTKQWIGECEAVEKPQP